MKTRLLAPVLLVGLAALAVACPELPTPEERLCQRYCYGQFQAVPGNGTVSCESSDDDYWDECVRACQKDLTSAGESCRTSLAQAYGCGADHSWFCVPKEDGGRTLTQFDTCRASWDAVYACEKASTDAGTP